MVEKTAVKINEKEIKKSINMSTWEVWWREMGRSKTRKMKELERLQNFII
jgi:hypothetical protein